MGLLGDVLGGLEAQAGQHAALYGEIATLVAQSGGVGGLIQKFEQNGMGATMAGCVGNGPNPPITADQIIQVIGQDKVAQIAARVGLTEPQVAAGMAKLLPVIIDHLTPHGTVPAPTAGSPSSSVANELEQGALNMLKAKLFG